MIFIRIANIIIIDIVVHGTVVLGVLVPISQDAGQY